jgi:mannose-1-phosphate guanylyltransferase
VESDNELPNGIRIACGTLLPVGAVRITAGPGGCPAGETPAAVVHAPAVGVQR